MKIVITADGRNLAATTGGQPLTSGSVGIEAAFILSADYDNLAVTAVFSAGETRVDVLLTTPCCIVPWEVLQKPGTTLFVGVVGKNGSGEIVIPTVWGRVGMIECGTEASGIDPEDPTPDIAAQILERARAALAEAAETKEAAAQSAQDAADDADRAEEAKQAAGTAQGAAETAQTAAEAARDAAASSATDAAESATTATQQAQAAATARTAAETAQNAAETAQTAAASLATDAAESATQAASSETAAAGSASDAATAKTAAEAAQTAAAASAAAASDSADSAASSATAASGSATAAANSATAAAASATAAGNAQTAAEAAQTAAVAAKTATESARDTAISTLQTEGAAQKTAIQQKGAEVIASIPADYTDLTEDVSDLKSALDSLLPSPVFPLSKMRQKPYVSTSTGRRLDNNGGIYTLNFTRNGNPTLLLSGNPNDAMSQQSSGSVSDAIHFLKGKYKLQTKILDSDNQTTSRYFSTALKKPEKTESFLRQDNMIGIAKTETIFTLTEDANLCVFITTSTDFLGMVKFMVTIEPATDTDNAALALALSN